MSLKQQTLTDEYTDPTQQQTRTRTRNPPKRYTDYKNNTTDPHDTTTETHPENTPPTQKLTTCPECNGSVHTSPHEHEHTCDDCGLIVSETLLDHGPDWRAFTHDERQNKSRTGAPSSNRVHDKGLSTNIDWKDRDASGKRLNQNQRRRMARLRTWDERARAKDSKERNLKQALGEIERMASALNLPDNVREMASVIYRRCLNEDLLRGRCIESMTTASLYAATRQTQLPRSMDEFIAVARLDEKPITRAYRYITRELGLKVQPPTATDYIPKISSELNVDQDTESLAETLLETSIKAGEHSGKHPDGLAAASLYAADLLRGQPDRLTQSGLADAAGVCEVTIRNRHREILEVNNEDPRMASPGTPPK